MCKLPKYPLQIRSSKYKVVIKQIHVEMTFSFIQKVLSQPDTAVCCSCDLCCYSRWSTVYVGLRACVRNTDHSYVSVSRGCVRKRESVTVQASVMHDVVGSKSPQSSRSKVDLGCICHLIPLITIHNWLLILNCFRMQILWVVTQHSTKNICRTKVNKNALQIKHRNVLTTGQTTDPFHISVEVVISW